MTRKTLVPLLCTSVFGCILACAASVADAWTSKTLYTFCSLKGCRDGHHPYGGVILDASGNLYGTTEFGGDKDSGVIFKLVRDSHTGNYTYTRLKSFCSSRLCADGAYPMGELILDTSGAVYGTTSGGSGYGEAYRLDTGGTFKILHRFCPNRVSCTDGSTPVSGLAYVGASSGLPYDGTSPLYGTTLGGGSHGDSGTVYQLSHGIPNWVETVLYNFCSEASCVDGSHPVPKLLADPGGVLYGTTQDGGTGNPDDGTVFRLDFDQASQSWQHTVLRSFCVETDCHDGDEPNPALVKLKGTLFGVTEYGGANGLGAAYRLADDGSSYQVAYSFCTPPNCADGVYPNSLVLAGATTFYGTQLSAVFQLHRNSDGTWHRTTIKKFDCVQCDLFQLVLDPNGNIFGTAYSGGGVHDAGFVFELSP